jgi:FAD/FMN-containing dehydrogenase
MALSMNGSMSAEHGLGFVKNGAVALYRSQVEHDLMLTMKAALDPKSTLNLGKVLRIENGAFSACKT